MKICKLVKNETIKTLKKTSTKVMIILCIIALFGAVGLTNLYMSLNNYVYVTDDDWANEMRQDIETIKTTISEEKDSLDKYTLADLESTVETYEIALKYNINYYSYYNYYWKIELLDNIMDAKYNSILDGNAEETNDVNEMIKLLENDDFSGYVERLKDELKAELDSKEITEEEYEDGLYLLNIEQKYEIGKYDGYEYEWKNEIYYDIQEIKNSLRTGINSLTGKLMTTEEIETLEENLKMNEYRLENNIPLSDSLASTRATYDELAPGFCLFMIAILMIIIAGSAISTEISKGTIKFLIFTPNKRWKILLSKIISATLILIILSIIFAALSTVIGNICFNEELNSAYLYVQNDVVKELSHFEYNIVYFMLSDINIFIYILFAIMLSVITRNTALSVRNEHSLLCWFRNDNAINKLLCHSRLDKIYSFQ